jgi:hypothetical protein
MATFNVEINAFFPCQCFEILGYSQHREYVVKAIPNNAKITSDVEAKFGMNQGTK